jgi:hypothetical protein
MPAFKSHQKNLTVRYVSASSFADGSINGSPAEPLMLPSAKEDAALCKNWEEASEAAKKIGYPVELSLKNCVLVQGMQAARSCAALRRSAHHEHEIEGVASSMLRAREVFREALLKRRSSLGPKAAAKLPATPLAQISVARLRDSSLYLGRDSAQGHLDYEGKAMWDGRLAHKFVMPCDSYNAVTRAAMLADIHAVIKVRHEITLGEHLLVLEIDLTCLEETKKSFCLPSQSDSLSLSLFLSFPLSFSLSVSQFIFIPKISASTHTHKNITQTHTSLHFRFHLPKVPVSSELENQTRRKEEEAETMEQQHACECATLDRLERAIDAMRQADNVTSASEYSLNIRTLYKLPCGLYLSANVLHTSARLRLL